MKKQQRYGGLGSLSDSILPYRVHNPASMKSIEHSWIAIVYWSFLTRGLDFELVYSLAIKRKTSYFIEPHSSGRLYNLSFSLHVVYFTF